MNEIQVILAGLLALMALSVGMALGWTLRGRGLATTYRTGDGFKEQLKVVVTRATDELVRRAEIDSRIGPDARFKQHGRARKFPLRLFLDRYLCPPSRAVAGAMFGEPGWIIVGEDVAYERLPAEGLPPLPDEAGYTVLLDILAERVVSSS